MAWLSGVWTPESTDLGSRVAKLTSTDSAFGRAAAAQGQAGVNRRGLVNSTMGIGSGIDASIKSALPIASQESQQEYGHNYTYMQNAQNDKAIAYQDRALAETTRDNAAKNMLTANNTYVSGISNTLANDKIPGGTRSAVQSDFAAQYTKNIEAIKGLYNGTNLKW